MKKTVSISLLIVILAFLFWYVYRNWAEFTVITQVSVASLILLLVMNLIYLFIQGMILKLLLKHFKISLAFYEWFGLAAITLMGNYLIPFGGFGLRAGYLKTKHNFGLNPFISSLALVMLIEFAVFTLGGIIALLLIPNGTIGSALLVILLIIFALCIFLFFAYNLLPKTSFLVKIAKVLSFWQALIKDKRLILKILAITILEFFIFCSMYYIAFNALNIEFAFLKTLLPSALTEYSFLLRLVPASVGVYEGALAFSASYYNLAVSSGLMVSALFRAANLFYVITAGPIFSYLLLGNILNKKGKR